jgi:transcription elongation GreA/GreB family factor
MSRAFVKEDVDPPERSGRVRSASGLPPGALNYMTARGAHRLRAKVDELRRANSDPARIAELETVLASITWVERPSGTGDSVSFGATVTVEENNGNIATYTVVGVDELGFYPDAISWISPLGKALLAAELGDRVRLEDDRTGTIVKIEHRAD